jgi:phosphomannomutase
VGGERRLEGRLSAVAAPLAERARAWLAADPDPATRAEVEALLAAGDGAALAERFGARLEFGTAGIRGILGGGPGRMNRALARWVAAGLGRVLLARVAGAGERGVVVGYDMRRLSRELALEMCGGLAGCGVRVRLLRRPSPTPVVAFGVVELGAAAGVVVTASHNPPEYNGIKVYWQNGAQIVPPLDQEISAAIDALGSPDRSPFMAPEAARAGGLLEEDAGDLEDRYLAAIARQAPSPPQPPPGTPAAAAPGIVYTPLHGVALELARRAFAARGFDRLSVVAEQAAPDGSFPTLRLPNPEEPDALDLALRQAEREGAGLVIAHDPDGDRLAAAVRAAGGGFRILSGDQIGCLLGWQLLELYQAAGALAAGAGCFVVTTVVSSSLLRRIAALYGVDCELTLTGLKWIWNRALERERQGGTFLFGYEEALGYSVGRAVRDKDGISAGVLLAETARAAAAAGKTLLDRLDEIEARAGVVATRHLSLPLAPAEGQRRVRRLLDRLCENGAAPRVGGLRVERIGDFEARQRRDLATGTTAPIVDLPPTPLVILELERDRSVRLRPSGTEPKLKLYLEAAEPPPGGAQLAAARSRATAALDELERGVRELLEPASIDS